MDIIKRIEEIYPECTDALMNNFDRAYDLWARKQSDYGDSNIRLGLDLNSSSSERSQNNRLAQLGVVIRMNDKISRWKNLMLKDRKANNESLLDSFKDLGNYSIIAQLVSKGLWTE